MSTVTGTYELADGTPDSGTVTLQPAITASDLTPVPRIITQGPVTGQLDDLGTVTLDVLASDDDGWAVEDSSPMPYLVTERLKSGYRSYAVLLMGAGPHDLATLQPIEGVDIAPYPVPGPPGDDGTDGQDGQDGHSPAVTVASTTTGAPGTPAAVVDLDAGLDVSLAFTIPQGIQGIQGIPGDVQKATIGNLLTDNQASGTDTLGDTTGFGVAGGGIVITSSTDYAAHGTKSVKWVCPSTNTSQLGVYLSPGVRIPVTPGTSYTFTAETMSPTSTNLIQVGVYFYSAASGNVGSALSPLRTATASFVRDSVTATAPATAATALMFMNRPTVGTAGATFYTDKVGWWKGVGGDWAMPGTPITGLQPTMDTVTLWADLPTYTTMPLGARIHVTSGLGFLVALRSPTGWVVSADSDTGSTWLNAVVWDTAGAFSKGSLPAGWKPRAGVAGSILVRRIGSWVIVRANQIACAVTSTNDRMWIATTGFDPLGNYTYVIPSFNSANASKIYATNAQLARGSGQAPLVDDYYPGFEITYTANPSWPTTAP